MSDWLRQRSRHGGADEIPLPVVTGRLWLCGKHFIAPDPERAIRATQAATVVCLNQPRELHDRYPSYVEWLRLQQDERAVWFPIPDLGAPSVHDAMVLIDDLCRRVEQGHTLLVHCGAGIGRAGTIATGLLMALGLSRDESLTAVAAHRPMAGPEAGAQRELLVSLDKVLPRR